MSESTFEASPGGANSVAIESSVVVLEEIRAEVSNGLLKFSRGGMEVGGVLYGTHDGNKVHIQAMRPMVCDHSNGPSFHLSADDRAKLDVQFAADAQDPHLQNLVRVGWFVSHTRSELVMAEADLEIFSTYFPEPWQVTMVVRPGRGSHMRGGFFVRETDGSVPADRSCQEFNFPDRIAGMMEAVPRAERPAPRASAPLPPLPQPAAPAPLPFRQSAYVPSSPAFEPIPYPTGPERKRWPWLVGALGLLAVLAFIGLRYFWQPAPPESLGLQVTEREGQLNIVWNSTSRSVVRATKGLLEISDGDASERVPLTRSQLSDGHYFYTRKGGDVEVRMQVESTDGPIGESARFLGRSPQSDKTDELQAAQAKQTELEQETERLKAANATLKDRIQQLERAQRILETRLGITSK